MPGEEVHVRLRRSDLNVSVPRRIIALFDLPMTQNDKRSIIDTCEHIGGLIPPVSGIKYSGWEVDYDQKNKTVDSLYFFWNCPKTDKMHAHKLAPFARRHIHGSGNFELYFDKLGRVGIHIVKVAQE
jgi:hypothetical protein